ncbi:MAG: RPA family protein, partial [Haloferacaceae archaeon]
MSADGDADAGDGDGDDGGPGRREVAQRVLAAEFDDATVSYRESDEERAPNYVVTPTGARINRLFAVGVLTEVEPVNDDVVRARIADPTDAFVSYAGQYQPDPLAFFERADPPAFVALTGKARTFEPDDGDRIYTSVRPESVNAVEAGTRDRWVVSAAEATLERVALFEEALAAGERGDALRDRLRSAGHREALAAGIPVAIERYGTTPAYLEAVRRTAVEALELVAGDRESVGGIDVAPDEGEPAEVGPTPEPSPVSADADGPDARAAGPDAGGGPGDGSADAATGEVDGESGPAAAEAADGDDAAADEAAQAATDGTAAADEAAGSAGAADGSDDAAAADGTTAADEPPTADDPVAADDGTSDDGSGLGDFDGGSLGGEEEGAESAPAGGGGAASVDEDEMYELDDEERREVE